MGSVVRVIFDAPPGPTMGRFIEVENEAGESTDVGEWVEDGKRWALEIPVEESARFEELQKNHDDLYNTCRTKYERIEELEKDMVLANAEIKTRAEYIASLKNVVDAARDVCATFDKSGHVTSTSLNPLAEAIVALEGRE